MTSALNKKCLVRRGPQDEALHRFAAASRLSAVSHRHAPVPRCWYGTNGKPASVTGAARYKSEFDVNFGSYKDLNAAELIKEKCK